MKRYLVLILLPIVLISCKRDKDPGTEEQEQLAADEAAITRETDQALDDANDVLTASRYGDGSAATLCGITVDSSQIASGIITLNFDGSTCFFGTRKREGQIEIKLSPLGNAWRDAGTSIQLTFRNYKVTRTTDDKYLILNGTKTITNALGGLIRQLTLVSNPVIHRLRGNLSIEFEDGTRRIWKIARKRTVRYDGNYVVKIEGDTAVGGFNLVSAWGTTRTGTVFYVTLESPLLFNSQCFRKPEAGSVVIYTIYRKFTVTMGVDENGSPSSGTCPYGYKIEWTDNKNREQTRVVQYR